MRVLGLRQGEAAFSTLPGRASPTGLAMTATGPGSAERHPPRGPQPRDRKADLSSPTTDTR